MVNSRMEAVGWRQRNQGVVAALLEIEPQGGAAMINRSRTGARCRTRHFVRTVKGDLPRGSRGTILYETENLGRQLILVDWDAGFAVPVFPDEVELEQQHSPAPH